VSIGGESMIVVGIGSEVIRALDRVLEYYSERPEANYTPQVVCIDALRPENVKNVDKILCFGRPDETLRRPLSLRSHLIEKFKSIRSELEGVIRTHNTNRSLVIGNIGGGTGSVGLKFVPKWLNDLGLNVHVLCILPSPDEPTYRPILLDNAMPTYMDLRSLLGKNVVKSITYLYRRLNRESPVFELFDDLKDLMYALDRCNNFELSGEFAFCKTDLNLKLKLRGFEIESDCVKICKDKENKKEILVDISNSLRKYRVSYAKALHVHSISIRPNVANVANYSLIVKYNNSELQSIPVDGYDPYRITILTFIGVSGFKDYEDLLRSVFAEYSPGKEFEVEEKFRVNPDKIQEIEKLIKNGNLRGISISHWDSLEQEDIYFDIDKLGDKKGNIAYLRLRRDDRGCKLTLKLEESKELERREIETVVDDFESVKAILETLFGIDIIIKKFRDEYIIQIHESSRDDVVIMSIDRSVRCIKGDKGINLGTFIEFRKNVPYDENEKERAKNLIMKVANILGLSEREKKSYRKLCLEERSSRKRGTSAIMIVR